jgi:hypothetical protein
MKGSTKNQSTETPSARVERGGEDIVSLDCVKEYVERKSLNKVFGLMASVNLYTTWDDSIPSRTLLKKTTILNAPSL